MPHDLPLALLLPHTYSAPSGPITTQPAANDAEYDPDMDNADVAFALLCTSNPSTVDTEEF